MIMFQAFFFACRTRMTNCSRSRRSLGSFLKDEIFIGRLSFRYISWIVINFIDNCHILMAWLCAWLSDCYCFVWFGLVWFLRAWHICTAKISHFLRWSFPLLSCSENCFRRKLLHEPKCNRGGEISIWGIRNEDICMVLLQAFLHIYAGM